MLQDPLIPDPDALQSQVLEELARPEYNQPDNPLTWAIYRLLQQLAKLFGMGEGDFPVSTVLMLVFAVVIVVMMIVVFLNPIRVRTRASVSVLDGQDVSLEESRQRARTAAQSGQWNEAVIWAYRTLALILDQHQVLTLAPGLTAQEVATRAAQAHSSHRAAFTVAARIFDDVRYGDIDSTQEDYAHISALVSLCDGGKAL